MINNKLQMQFLVLLLIGFSILSFFILLPFLTTLSLAILCTVILYPIYRKIVSSVHGHEVTASVLTVIFTIICILIPLSFLVSQLFNELIQFYNTLVEGDTRQNLINVAIHGISDVVTKIIPSSKDFFIILSTNLDNYSKQSLSWVIQNSGTVLSSVSVLILDLLIFVIALFYLLIDGKKLKNTLVHLIPFDTTLTDVLFQKLELTVNSIFKGSLIIALLQGILTGVGFALFGISNSILWGSLAIIASLIPRIGTALILIPGILYLFFGGKMFLAIGLMIWGLTIVGLIDNVLGPKLIGKNIHVHPLLILLSVVGGIGYYGPIGIFLGPLTITMLLACIDIYTITIKKRS